MSSGEEYSRWLAEVGVAGGMPGEGGRKGGAAAEVKSPSKTGLEVGEVSRAWGDPFEEYNSDAEHAREQGWLDPEGRLTIAGAEELKRRTISLRDGKKTPGKEPPKRTAKREAGKGASQPEARSSAKRAIKAMLAKYGYGEMFSLFKIDNSSGQYRVNLFNRVKGSHEVKVTFVGTLAELRDKIEDYFREVRLA